MLTQVTTFGRTPTPLPANCNLTILSIPLDAQGKISDKTMAVINMGPSSVQLTFMPPKVPQSSAYSLMYADKHFTLYSHNYMGFGADAAYMKYLEHLTQQGGAFGNLITSPCDFQVSMPWACGFWVHRSFTAVTTNIAVTTATTTTVTATTTITITITPLSLLLSPHESDIPLNNTPLA